MKEIQIKLSKEGKTEILAFGLTSDEVIESMSIAYIQSIHTINDLPIRKCV